MTSTFDNVGLTFTGKSPDPASATSTSPADEPGIITTPDGKKFKITVEVQDQGVWKKVDTSRYGQAEKFIVRHLFDRCFGIHMATTGASEVPSSLTVTFDKNDKTESFTSRTLGKIFSRFKEDVVLLKFKKLEYKASDGAPVKVFDLESESMEDAEAMAIHNLLDSLSFNPLTQDFYHNIKSLTAKPRKIKPPEAPFAADPASVLIDQSIHEAGGQDNRCAALSLAKMELEKDVMDMETEEFRKNTLEEIKDKYDLDERLVQTLDGIVDEKEKIRTLAEAFVQKAADKIEDPSSENPFLNQKIQDQRQPCLAAITTALRALGEPTAGYPREVLKRYAQKIRDEHVMLDLPFFLALDQPFIIIHKPDGALNQIGALGGNFEITDTIENCDFDSFNIFFYNSRDHYKAVKLDTDEKKDAMRQLLRRAMDERIDGLVTYLNKERVKSSETYRARLDAENLFEQYPNARDELIQKLQVQYPDKLTDDVIARIKSVVDIGQFLKEIVIAIHN